MPGEAVIYNQPPKSWYTVAKRHLDTFNLRFPEMNDEGDTLKHRWCYWAVENCVLGLRAESGLVAEVRDDAGDIKELLFEAASNLGCPPENLPLPSCILENIDVIRTWRYVGDISSVCIAAYGCEPLLDAGLCTEIVEDLEQWVDLMLSRG